MKRTIKISVPENMYEVKVETYARFLDAIKDTKDDKEIGKIAFEIFCGISPGMEKQMPKKKRDEVGSILVGMANKTYGLMRRFTFEGVEYGLHPNLDDMKLGEFVDADNYSREGKDIAKFLSVLYRPISKTKRDRYSIDSYDGTGERVKVMEQQSAALYLGVCGFFLRIAMTLMNCTLNSTSRQETPRMMKGSSAKNGGGSE